MYTRYLVPAAEIRDHETGLVSGPFSRFQSRQLFLKTHKTATNSIDERFALKATPMLDQPNTSIKGRFCSKSNEFRFTFLSKRIQGLCHLSSLRKLLEAFYRPSRDSILHNSDAV